MDRGSVLVGLAAGILAGLLAGLLIGVAPGRSPELTTASASAQQVVGVTTANGPREAVVVAHSSAPSGTTGDIAARVLPFLTALIGAFGGAYAGWWLGQQSQRRGAARMLWSETNANQFHLDSMIKSRTLDPQGLVSSVWNSHGPSVANLFDARTFAQISRPYLQLAGLVAVCRERVADNRESDFYADDASVRLITGVRDDSQVAVNVLANKAWSPRDVSQMLADISAEDAAGTAVESISEE